MKKQPETILTIAKWGYFAVSVLLIVLGVLFMVFPETSISVMVKLSAVIMMIFGIIKIAGHFSQGPYRGAFQFDLELGALLIVLGLAVLLKPDGAVNFLCIALGISVFTDGIFKMRISFESRKLEVSGWWLTFAASVLAMVIGLILVFRPSDSAGVIMAVIGLSLIIDGILNLCGAITALRIIRAQTPEVIEVDSFEIGE